MKTTIYTTILLLYVHHLFAQTWQETHNKADSLAQKRNFKNAIPLYEQALTLAEKEFGKNTENYLKTRNGLGNSMIYTSPKDKTEPLLIENIELAKQFGDKTAVYAQALHNAGIFYLPSQRGNKPLKSEEYTKQALVLRKEIFGEKHPVYASSISNLAILNRELENYVAAEQLYKQSIQIYKTTFGEKHLSYANALNNLANMYKVIGNYSAAELFYKNILPIYRELLGEKHLTYLNCLNELATLYYIIGNYKTTETLFKQSMQLRKEVFGEKSPEYALILNNIALLYSDMGYYSLAEPLLKQALQIKKETTGDKNLSYSASLNNLGLLYANTGNYSAAEQVYKQSLQIRKELLGEKHPEYANSLNNLANLYKDMNKPELAYSFFEKGMAIFNLNIKENEAGYLSWTNAYAQLYQQNGADKQTDSLFQRIKSACFQKVLNNFPNLSEREKTEYYNNRLKVSFNNFNSFAIDKKLNEQLYDLQLFSKGILLNSTQKMKNRILLSEDTVLIKKYKNWNSLKLNLTKYQQMNVEDFKKTGLKLDSLENVVNEIEKSLAQQSEVFANLTDKQIPTWQAIQKKLKHKEAAIEIIRINKFGVKKVVTDTSNYTYRDSVLQKTGVGFFPTYSLYNLTDTVYYAALIVTKKSKQPELVILTNGNDLENKLYKYYRNTVLYKIKDTQSYGLFWQPIQEKLGRKIKKVYFSPDGIYNQINLNNLLNPKSMKYVLDELDIHPLTNTKEILDFQATASLKKSEKFSSLFFARPSYDMDSTQYVDNLKLSQPSENAYALRDIVDLQTGKFIDLVGTEEEVLKIDSLLKAQNLTTEKYLYTQATEQRIKSAINPTILHIATHGFFVKDETDKNPMLNSGLLLAGVGNYYRGNEKLDTDDGVLTAYEAQNLALDHTDLVVLSACETGLGEVRYGEGVYGLQRAFKSAGAKSILMSLWKVDDHVTQELMTRFYANWLKIGDKRQAFRIAQKEVRKKYKNSYYWGAFVMVGE